MSRSHWHVVIAQVLVTSLWFASNAVSDDLRRSWSLSETECARLLLAVQAGFIIGCAGIALSGLADRFPARNFFAVSALLGAVANAGFAYVASNVSSAFWFRLATGAALAGTYPMGMKIVQAGSSKQTRVAMAWLTAGLTLGTAAPHLLRSLGRDWPWQLAVAASSGLAVMGALLVWLFGEKQLKAATASRPSRGAWLAFGRQNYRAASLGYFGHIWELYAFWSLVPVLINLALGDRQERFPTSVSFLAFAVIATGSIGCIFGGWLSLLTDSRTIAMLYLAISGTVCLVYPLLQWLSPWWLMLLLLLWGLTVMGDAAQIWVLSAEACPRDVVAGGLALQLSIGFLLTTIAVSWTASLWPNLGVRTTWLLLPGPAIGVIGLGFLPRSAKTGGPTSFDK